MQLDEYAVGIGDLEVAPKVAEFGRRMRYCPPVQVSGPFADVGDAQPDDHKAAQGARPFRVLVQAEHGAAGMLM